jgi:hypothetical protein
LLSIAEAKKSFRDLAATQGFSNEIVDAAFQRKPFACYSVLSGKKVDSEGFSEQYYASGLVNCRLVKLGPISCIVTGISEDCFQDLNLQDHDVLGASGIYRWADHALEEMQRYYQVDYEYISQWSPYICWLKKKPYSKSTEITSVSVPIFPFCSFVSSKAIRHIPPKNILKKVGFYCLNENIFHEALHHQLSCTLIFTDIIACERENWPLVHIPWRNTEWPLDRVLHAAWVYQNLINFRTRHLAKGDAETLLMADEIAASLYEATNAFSYLIQVLEANVAVFTSDGRSLVKQIALNL